jgi:hypothetical protein
MTQGTFLELDVYDPSRSNLFPNSRALDNASWYKNASTISANAATAPDNRVLADKLVENVGAGEHFVERQSITTVTNVQHVLSVWAKADTRSLLRLAIYSAGALDSAAVHFNLATGAQIFQATGGTAVIHGWSIEAYGGGWYRCAMRCTPKSTNAGSLFSARFHLLNTGINYVGDGTSGLFLDRPLLEVASVLGDPIDTAAVAGPGITVRRYSSAPFTTRATDVPPHVVFDPRLDEALSFSRKMFGDLRVKSGGEIGYGLIRLRNDDHALASLLDLGVVGREARVYVGDPDVAAFPAGFTLQLRGAIDQLEVGASIANLRLRDRQAVLAQPLQPTKYAGTNALPAGVEGVAGDLKGKEKPSCWGRCYHVPAPCVNTSKRIYQVHSGAVQAIDAVYEGGAAITYSGTDHANQAALEAAATPAGQFDKCTALGLFRLGSDPSLKISADVRGDNVGGYVDRPGAIVRRILETRAGVVTADIATATITELDAAANYEVGYWTAEAVSIGDALLAVRQSVAAWCVPTRSGAWQVGRLEAPAVSPDFAHTDVDIVDLDRVASADKDGGVPVWRVVLRYKPWFAAFAEGELAGGLAQATKAALLAEWRVAAAEDAAVKTTHPLAAVLELDTLLTTEADAVAEAGRLLALHKVRRDLVQERIPLTEVNATIDLGATVKLTTTALGYSAGRLFRVAGVTPEDRVIDLLLWG